MTSTSYRPLACLKSALLLAIAISNFPCFLLWNGFCVHGMPANPEPLKYEQPDGTETPLIYFRGDEYYNWMEDANGYTVIQDENDWYVYATNMKMNNNKDVSRAKQLLSSGGRIGYVNPKKMGLKPNLALDHYHEANNDNSDISKDNNSNNANEYSHMEESVEHRGLLNVPSNALCNFGGSKRDPCELRNLALLIRFSNHKNRKLPDRSKYDKLFNHNGPTDDDTAPTGSISDVFLENSYDKFKAITTVSNWIDVGRSEKDTVDGKNGLNRPGTKETWKKALTIYENSRGEQGMKHFDGDGDGNIDALCLMHSGVGAEHGGKDCESSGTTSTRVWSHATGGRIWSSKDGKSTNRYYVASALWGRCPKGGAFGEWAIARIAVIAHEMGHFLGLPDLYDGAGGQGIGRFDMQGQCWGWKRNQLYPPLLGAWSKLKLKWVKVTDIQASGNYVAGPSCTSDQIFRVSDNMPPGEYFLIENRFGCGFDAELSPKKRERYRGGLAIWHIDESGQSGIHFRSRGYPGDGQWPKRHYKVALKQCDGEFSLEKNKGQGDELDLCKHDPEGILRRSEKQGYSIGPEGLTLTGGTIRPETNTHSYSSGKEIPTQIRITAGEVAQEMQFSVSLRGEEVNFRPTPPPPTPRPPTKAPTPSPTPLPPTKAPTPSPTPRPPTKAPTPSPTPLPPTKAPTPSPTPIPPTKAPTPSPTPIPPTKAPTPSPTLPPPTPNQNRSGQRPTLGGNDNRSGQRPTLGGNARSGFRPSNNSGQKNGVRSNNGYVRSGRRPIGGGGSTTRRPRTPVGAIPITCDNAPTELVRFRGVGRRQSRWRIKACSSIMSMDVNQICPLTNDYTRQQIYLTCQKECNRLSKCNVSA